MTVLDTDLTEATDLQLDVGLRRLYVKHRNAEPEERLAWHAAINEILAEQKRRRDLWLADHAVV